MGEIEVNFGTYLPTLDMFYRMMIATEFTVFLIPMQDSKIMKMMITEWRGKPLVR